MNLQQAAKDPRFNQPYLQPNSYTIFALDRTKSKPTLLTFQDPKDIDARLHKRITPEEWNAICELQGEKKETVEDLTKNDLLSTDTKPVKENETEARYLQLKAQGFRNLNGKERTEYSRLKEIYDPKLS